MASLSARPLLRLAAGRGLREGGRRLRPAPPTEAAAAAAAGAGARGGGGGGQRRGLASSSSLPKPSSSLIPETLAAMEEDEQQAAKAKATATAGSANDTPTAAGLRAMGRERLSLEERKRRRRALDGLGLKPFAAFLEDSGLAPLTRQAPLTTLQLNIGLYCNQACSHCHVESSPKRTREQMDRATADRCLDFLRRSRPGVTTLDLTGGAPELNAQFRHLVEGAAPLGVEIIDRCNLTVLEEPGQEDLPAFLARHRVRVVASLPCYEETNVNRQRGASVYRRSIAGLRRLNAVGYGQEGSGLRLTLVYNPVGAFLPPPQAPLEATYKAELAARHGVAFSDLICLTNMPIKRFADALHRAGRLGEYMELLVRSFNPEAVAGLMCRSHLSVGWDGRLYDCDFNQQLGMALPGGEGKGTAEGPGLTIFDVPDASALAALALPIGLDNHCFGCTAGQGSSCGGSTATATATATAATASG